MYIVLIPYGSTVKNKTIQLTLPSKLVTETAIKLYTPGKKLILCGDESFDTPLFKETVTTHLMKDLLLKNHVKQADIICVGDKNANTVQQLDAVAKYQKENDLEQEPFLLLCLPYHKQRINLHLKPYGLTGKAVAINEVDPDITKQPVGDLFDPNFEPTEKLSRFLSQLDPKGYNAQFFTWLGGPRIVDVVNGKAKLLLGKDLYKRDKEDKLR